jgi:myo-inositol 2-dehydrogenase / D-chiro-inositol 1-dehydrogenase
MHPSRDGHSVGIGPGGIVRLGRCCKRTGRQSQPYAYPGTHTMEINRSDGRLLIEDTVRRYTFDRAGNETAHVWQAGCFDGSERMFHRPFDRHTDACLAALRAGEEPPVHARAGCRALVLAYAIIESFKTGRRVSTPA